MPAPSAITGNRASSAVRQSGGEFPQSGETNRRVINAIKQLYEFPSVVLGRWLGISDKSTKRKLAGERSLSVEEIGALLRSERGYEILSAVMGDAKPEWWRLCSVLMDAADIRRMQIVAQKRAARVLKGVVDADRDLSDDIQRAETLAFYGSEQAGVHADALRSVARAQNRPMAPKTKS